MKDLITYGSEFIRLCQNNQIADTSQNDFWGAISDAGEGFD